MQRFSPAIVFFATILLAAAQTFATDGDQVPAALLVVQLGDDSFEVRQLAERALSERGLPARDALLAGLQQPDAEIRRRCRRVLAHVLELDYQQRLEAFIADSEGQQTHDLPGWAHYREIAGDTSEARELFAAMQQAEGGLLESLETGANEAIRWRLIEIWQLAYGQQTKKRELPSRATLAAMLLAYAESPIDTLDLTQLWNNFSNLLFQGDFAKSLKEGPYQESTRALVANWIRKPTNRQLDSQKLRISLIHGIDDVGRELALEMLTKAAQRAPNEAAMAIEATCRLGGKTYAAMVEDLFDDQRMCLQRVVKKDQRMEVQVRDIALAWLLHVTEQNHEAYGLKQAEAWFKVLKTNPQNAFNFGNFFFEQDADRDAAFKRWSAWVAKNPLPVPPKVEGGQPDVADQPPAPVDPVAPSTVGFDELAPGIRLAERTQVSALKRACALVEDGRHVEAITLLGEIIAADMDFFYQPDRDVPLYRQLKAQAERLLADFPVVSRDTYELHFGSIARHQLRHAMAKLDLAEIAEVERKYFFTEAGTEAAFVLATQHRLAGRHTQAALYLERLQTLSPLAHRFEPSLSLQLAICWHQAGILDKTRQVLQQMQKRSPTGTVELGGQPLRLFAENEDPILWLEHIVGSSSLSEPQWAVFRGNASGTVNAAPGTPLLDAPVLADLADDPLLVEVADEVAQAFRDERRTMLTTLCPLVIGDVVVVRTPVSIRASNLVSGHLLWETPGLNALWYLLRFGDAEQQKTQREYVRDGLRQRLWEDPCFGTLTSNGHMLFAIEDLGFRLGPEFQRPIVRADGLRELDTAALRGANQLAAFDVRTGKLVWQAGSPDTAESEPLAGARFLGPPLPLGDQLYAVVDLQDQTLLIALDAASGTVQNRWVLDSPWDEPVVPQGVPAMTWIEPDPTRGVNPVFSDGLIICRTLQSRYVAVDLAARALRWAFAPPPRETPIPLYVANWQQKKMLKQQAADRSDQWCDAGPMVADGRVLLTPWETDEVYCLNLADGTLAWSAPRADGLYLAGVAGDRVVVVGRGNVRALAIEDGSPCHSEPITLPLGAAPSGRGYLSDRRLYVPLTTAEVAVIDVEQGKLIGRSQSPGGQVPGNLARMDDTIVSWGPSGLFRYNTVESQVASFAGRELTPDDDLQSYLRLTELLLYLGQIDIAVDRLQQAQALQPTAEAARLLGEALLQLDGDHWQDWQQLAIQVEQSISAPGLRARFLERLADSYRQAGQIEAAIGAYLAVVDASGEDDPLVFVTSVLSARRSRVLQANIESCLMQLPPARRIAFEQQIADRLITRPTAGTLTAFAFHPAADELRLQLASEMQSESPSLQAELWLREVWRNGTDPLRARAAAQLAERLRAADRHLEAARFYTALQDHWSDTLVNDEQTGSQIVDVLPFDAPVRGWLGESSPWPRKTPKIDVTKIEPAKAKQVWQSLSLPVTGDGTALCPLGVVDIDMRTRKLISCDGQGVQLSEVDLNVDNQANQVWFNNYAMNEGRQTGHLLVVWLGTRILAIDQLVPGGRILWSVDTMRIEPNQWWLVPQLQMRMQARMQGAQMLSRLPQPFVVTPGYVAFQQGRILTAVDPLTGETLWLRDDLEPGCDLFGDEQLLMVTPINADTAIVLSAIDGHEMGRRTVPNRDNRLMTLGHQVLSWEVAGEHTTLQLIDPWTEQPVWSRQFSSAAKAQSIDGFQIGIMEPTGELIILNVANGATVIESQLDAEPELEELLILRNNWRYIVIANRPQPKQEGPSSWNRALPGHMLVEGNVCALDARTGQQQWAAEVTQQSIKTNYPTYAPVLTFFRRYQKAIKTGNNSWRSDQPQILLHCLDNRDGKTLHKTQIEKSYDQGFGFLVEPDKGAVTVQTRLEQIRFEYPKR